MTEAPDPLARKLNNWPPALAGAGRAMAREAEKNPAVTESDLALVLDEYGLLPGFRIGEMEREDGRLVAVTLEEALPNPPDTLAVRSREGVFAAHSPYIITSSVPAAEPEQLMQAGEDYPVHILARYTQLPPDLPGRINGLAREITVGYDTALREGGGGGGQPETAAVLVDR